MGDLTFEPLIPGSLWLVLAAAGVALLAWYAVHRPAAVSRRRFGGIVALMSVAFALVLALLLNPTWSRQLPPPAGKPVLTVLLDTSGSMSTPDATGTRFAAAGRVATELASDLSDRFDVRIRAFDQTLRRLDAAAVATTVPDGPGTDLATAVNASLTEEHAQGQAVVLLSDGIDNAGGGTGPVLAAVRTAKAMAAPIYTRTFGGDVRQMDLAVDIRSPQDMAVVGQKVPLAARVTAVGVTAVKTNVTLWHGGREVARREVTVGTNADADVTFQIQQDKVGLYPYEVRVDPLPGEASQANNSAGYVLRVVDEPMRVLVVEGKPYWDSKFLTRTLMADPAVALDCVVRLSDSRLLRRTLTHQHGPTTAPGNAAPTPDPTADATGSDRVETWQIDSDPAAVLGSADKLRGYQVIVVGRDAEPFLTPAAVANLQDWVARQGGSLLCYRGSPTSDVDQRLAKLLPVRWAAAAPSRFRVALTAQGKDLNWFSFDGGAAGAAGGAVLPRLPSLSAADTVDSAKPLAVVLATEVGSGTASAPAPAVVYQQYGSGRVVVVEGSGMWRWAFLAPQYQGQEQVYATLWHSMLRWLTSAQGLTPGQTFSLRAEKVRFGTDEPATATLLAREDVPRDKLPAVQLSAEGSKEPPKTFAPAPVGSEAGVFRINFGMLPEGRYTARLAGAAHGGGDDPSAEVVFDVRRYDQEMMDLQARPDLMARIATDSGGAVLPAASDAAAVRAAFAEHLARVQPPRFERATAWDRWWLLAAVLGLWTCSWFARRSGGLV
jgi:hypothetical protein